MPQEIINLLNKATQAATADTFRRGNLISLPKNGTLIVTGDIHGNRRNFERIIAFTDLPKNPNRHVVLQEIIHGGPQDENGGCLSYELLFDVIRYKLEYPDRLHIIMGNHATAFINDSEVLKNGKEMNRSMSIAIDHRFKQASSDVKAAIKRYLFSLPLAIKCENRLWISHSLPSDRYVANFDPQIFHRPLEKADTVKPGSVYLLTWGRNHSQQLLDSMAQLLDVDIFILGHQPQQNGYTRAGRNLLIIASDHDHGCLLPIDLSKSYNPDQLIGSIVPLASIS